MQTKKATTAATKDVSKTISIPPLSISIMKLTLIGDSPLITHEWSAKAKKMMLDKQMKKATGAREAKNAEQDYKDSLYVHPDGGYGFPAIAFKAAAVDAATSSMALRRLRCVEHFTSMTSWSKSKDHQLLVKTSCVSEWVLLTSVIAPSSRSGRQL